MLSGLIAMQKFRFEEAVELLGQAIGIQPDPWSLANRGACHMKLGRLEMALADTRAAIAIEPDFSEAHVRLATILHGMERFAEALDALDQARSLA